jgi:hypothetical protein
MDGANLLPESATAKVIHWFRRPGKKIPKIGEALSQQVFSAQADVSG